MIWQGRHLRDLRQGSVDSNPRSIHRAHVQFISMIINMQLYMGVMDNETFILCRALEVWDIESAHIRYIRSHVRDVHTTRKNFGKRVWDMEWKDLSRESKCVLEQCWSIYSDRPQTFKVELGQPLNIMNVVITPTESTYEEILKYVANRPYINVQRQGNTVTVRGIGTYGHWDTKVTT